MSSAETQQTDTQAARPAAEQPLTAAAQRARAWSVPLMVLIGLALGSAAMVFTGAAAPTLIGDGGPLGRYALPAAKFIFNLSMAVTVSALIFASLVIPRLNPATRTRHKDQAKHPDGQTEDFDPAWLHTLLIAEVASVVWTLAATAVTILSYIDTAGSQAFLGNFSAGLGQYLMQVDSGRMWLGMTLWFALLSTLIFGVRSYNGIAWLTAASLAPLIPLSLMGHSSEASGHTEAVNSLGLHLLAVVVWVGGLVVLVLLAPTLTGRKDLRNIIERFSDLALVAVAVVIFSGFINAFLRVRTLDDWTSPYGLLIVAKTVATIVLMLIGYRHRSFVIGRLGEAPKNRAEVRAAGFVPTADTVRARAELWRLILVETLIMGGIVAGGVVLARSEPPVSQDPPATLTPAEILTGEPLPPEPTWANYFLQYQLDPLWLAVAIGSSIAYFLGYRSLRRRGIDWPLYRVLLWFFGMLLLIYVTSGGVVVYGKVLFSGHMIQHMLLVMMVPLPLVMAAPITLLMRATPPRQDGSRGMREWILLLVHSKYLQFWAHPVVAGVNFSGSLVVFYWSGIMIYALQYHLGHELMILHFFLAGYMFAAAMIGIDPGGKKFPPGVSLLVLLITMAFHAFFGVSIMSAEVLIEGDWYGNMGQEWRSALDDQKLGGDIAWGIGELPTLFMAVIAAMQWSKQSKREEKRYDRAESRSGDAELKAYNEMLAALNAPRKKN